MNRQPNIARSQPRARCGDVLPGRFLPELAGLCFDAARPFVVKGTR